MPDKLSWEEIKRRYPDEWVVLVDTAFDDNEDPKEGVVYDHGRNRAELYARCRPGPAHTAVLYTGEILGGRIGFRREDLIDKGQPVNPTPR